MVSKDWCTFFPDGCWGECCKRHDRRYETPRLSKYQADKLLYRCVARKKNKFVASIMFIGVSLLGYYWYRKAQKGK